MVSTALHTPIIERPHIHDPDGIQKLYRFPNGYGASVIRFQYSYGGHQGLWELAVIRFIGESNDRFDLAYDTGITDDVLGRLDEDEVQELLKEISLLTPKQSSAAV